LTNVSNFSNTRYQDKFKENYNRNFYDDRTVIKNHQKDSKNTYTLHVNKSHNTNNTNNLNNLNNTHNTNNTHNLNRTSSNPNLKNVNNSKNSINTSKSSKIKSNNNEKLLEDFLIAQLGNTKLGQIIIKTDNQSSN